MTSRRTLLAALPALAACGRRDPLPVFNSVPPFTLTAQSGLPFSREKLAGAPWIASFFFASCNGPCPRMNTTVHRLQEATYSFRKLQFVSFTVDPERDTPEALAAYARRYKADPERWTFLTGPRHILSTLSRDAFLAGELDLAQSHATRFYLVDQSFRVRGHFQGLEQDGVAALEAAITQLYEDEG